MKKVGYRNKNLWLLWKQFPKKSCLLELKFFCKCKSSCWRAWRLHKTEDYQEVGNFLHVILSWKGFHQQVLIRPQGGRTEVKVTILSQASNAQSSQQQLKLWEWEYRWMRGLQWYGTGRTKREMTYLLCILNLWFLCSNSNVLWQPLDESPFDDRSQIWLAFLEGKIRHGSV